MARGPCNEWTFSKKCNEYKKIKIYLCFIKSFELKIKIICRRNIFFLIYIKVFSSFFFPFLEDKKNQRDGEKAHFRQRQKIIIFFISCILFTIFCLCLKMSLFTISLIFLHLPSKMYYKYFSFLSPPKSLQNLSVFFTLSLMWRFWYLKHFCNGNNWCYFFGCAHLLFIQFTVLAL